MSPELLIVIGLFTVSFILEIKFRVVLFHSFRERAVTIGFLFVVLTAWEQIIYRYSGTWTYPGPGLMGISIAGLPLEMYLFFLGAIYFTFVTYELIHRNIDNERK